MYAIVTTAALPRQLALVLLLALAGCTGDNDKDLQSGADKLYERAQGAMESGNYRNAIGYYENLEARFPFSNQAKQAQLDLIYVYFKNGEEDSAIDAALQFERENPTHPRVDYAMYMRGLALFEGQSNTFHRLLDVDLAERPPRQARESFSVFAQLLQRFPNSVYAPDARQRMIFLRNRLADYENNVARYYLNRRAYMAALNRAKFAVENYEGAPAIAESLRIMVDSYRALGMQELAESTREVLAATFPDAARAQAQAEEAPWWKFW